MGPRRGRTTTTDPRNMCASVRVHGHIPATTSPVGQAGPVSGHARAASGSSAFPRGEERAPSTSGLPVTFRRSAKRLTPFLIEINPRRLSYDTPLFKREPSRSRRRGESSRHLHRTPAVPSSARHGCVIIANTCMHVWVDKSDLDVSNSVYLGCSQLCMHVHETLLRRR